MSTALHARPHRPEKPEKAGLEKTSAIGLTTALFLSAARTAESGGVGRAVDDIPDPDAALVVHDAVLLGEAHVRSWVASCQMMPLPLLAM